jgi:hypothetical protein
VAALVAPEDPLERGKGPSSGIRAALVATGDDISTDSLMLATLYTTLDLSVVLLIRISDLVLLAGALSSWSYRTKSLKSWLVESVEQSMAELSGCCALTCPMEEILGGACPAERMDAGLETMLSFERAGALLTLKVGAATPWPVI